jgi:hypothetical protein
VPLELRRKLNDCRSDSSDCLFFFSLVNASACAGECWTATCPDSTEGCIALGSGPVVLEGGEAFAGCVTAFGGVCPGFADVWPAFPVVFPSWRRGEIEIIISDWIDELYANNRDSTKMATVVGTVNHCQPSPCLKARASFLLGLLTHDAKDVLNRPSRLGIDFTRVHAVDGSNEGQRKLY